MPNFLIFSKYRTMGKTTFNYHSSIAMYNYYKYNGLYNNNNNYIFISVLNKYNYEV